MFTIVLILAMIILCVTCIQRNMRLDNLKGWMAIKGFIDVFVSSFLVVGLYYISLAINYGLKNVP
jgi:hypothetical protein